MHPELEERKVNNSVDEKLLNNNNNIIKIKEKSKCRSLIDLLSLTFTEFSEISTIHGIRYLGERKRPLYEKIFWIAIYIFTFYGCYYLVHGILIKWQQTPVIVSFSERSDPIWHIPFPAITYCTTIKSDKKVFDIDEVMKKFKENPKYFNEREDEHKTFQALMSVCNNHIFEWYLEFTENNGINTNLSTDIIDELNKIEKSSYFGSNCFWLGEQLDCSKYTQPILTSNGVCHTFNAIDLDMIYRHNIHNIPLINNKTLKRTKKFQHRWSLEDGYNMDAGIHTYPLRVAGTIDESGFKLISYAYKNNTSTICEEIRQGVKVIIHPPNEIPATNNRFIIASYGQHTSIKITPDMMRTDTKLRTYQPEQRQCYFNDERYLQFFIVYTQNNCKLECLTNWTLKECGCVKFYMPKLNTTRICDISEINCVRNAEKTFINDQLKTALHHTNDGLKGHMECYCLPACTSLSYKEEISQIDLELEPVKKIFPDFLNGNLTYAIISISFQEDQFIPAKRSELYGTTDFMANCGGLLALFLGTSVISVIEFIYFFTIRLFIKLYH